MDFDKPGVAYDVPADKTPRLDAYRSPKSEQMCPCMPPTGVLQYIKFIEGLLNLLTLT